MKDTTTNEISGFRKETCLNGWWDIKPVFGALDNAVPTDGWTEKSYLVPSFWTKPADAVRRKGDVYFSGKKDIFKEEERLDNYEFLFDAFGYPAEWSRTRNAWLRRSFDVQSVGLGRRILLRLDAVTPRCRLYVNGMHVTSHIHPTLPLEADITPYVKQGANELAVLVLDYEKDEKGRALSPSGNWIPEIHSGVWQDVFMIERGDVFVSDVTVHSSVRRKRLEVAYEFTNVSSRTRTLVVHPRVTKWSKGSNAASSPVRLTLPDMDMEIPPFEKTTVKFSVKWESPELWSPESPILHNLVTELIEDGVPVDFHVQRFGFREVWLDGPDLMLNGHPIHLFSDWGHKVTPYYYTEAWIRKWFGMIRDANMNHSRLHTHPHPGICLDLADEEGILITGETGIHGSGGHQGSDSLDYWNAAADHIRRFVRRDKNHPSIVMWSVENEMRWNGNRTSIAAQQLPRMRRLFNSIDPTRPAYHEGDSSLWDERRQPIISRHYNKPCSGYGWWDRANPLHCGEMALYHLAGPNNTAHIAGDAAWSSFKALDEAAAIDAALVIETGRTLGVCCFGPWNLSCLENLRMETKPVKLEYNDWTVPGVKPIHVPPHSSEFSFWREGKGYTPNYSFAIQADAFRPLAVIDRSRKAGYYAGSSFERELFVVNDTSSGQSGTLEAVLIAPDGATVKRKSLKVNVARGRVGAKRFSFKIPVSFMGLCRYAVKFISADGSASDSWERQVKVARAMSSASAKGISRRLAVFGPGSLKRTLALLDLTHSYVSDMDADTLAAFSMLILEKGTVRSGSVQNRQLRDFVHKGGRVLVMEQKTSLFNGLPITDKPLQTQFIRAPLHPIFNELASADFAFWGNDPYPMQGGDNYVVESPYTKDSSGNALFLLDGDEGGFGTGGMGYSGLLEVREGDGTIIACQLMLSDKMDSIPAAQRLFLNMLRHLNTYTPSAAKAAAFVNGSGIDAAGAAKIAESVRIGATVVVENATEDSIAALSSALGVPLKPVSRPEEYQVVRVKDDPVLAGISNEDTCGIDNFTYSPADKRSFRIGSLFLEPSPGLEPLLETATESCLKEMHVFKGRIEPLRTHTQSRFLHAEKPERTVSLGRLKFGAGELLICQFAPEDLKAVPRLSRLPNRLRANLGIPPQGSLLDAPFVPEYDIGAPGYPECVAVLNQTADAQLRRSLIENTRFFADLFAGQPILTLARWNRIECKGGAICAEAFDIPSDIYIFFGLHSPTRRKDLVSNLGVPNPDVLSFLDLEGAGSVEFILNGVARPELTIAGGRATISDVALEQGMNQVLLRWRPASQSSMLKIRWRNIKGQTERGFTFQVN